CGYSHRDGSQLGGAAPLVSSRSRTCHDASSWRMAANRTQIVSSSATRSKVSSTLVDAVVGALTWLSRLRCDLGLSTRRGPDREQCYEASTPLLDAQTSPGPRRCDLPSQVGPTKSGLTRHLTLGTSTAALWHTLAAQRRNRLPVSRPLGPWVFAADPGH